MSDVTVGHPVQRAKGFLIALAVATLALIGLSAYRPDMIGNWLLENVLVVALLIVLFVTYRRLPLSKTSYLLIFAFLSIHEWGAHYRYATVPLGEWLKPIFGTTRNHYDRIAHFCFGLLFAYPMFEVLVRSAGARKPWAYYLPVETALAFGAMYEIMESTLASIVSPEAGESFVGLQGDMWDAQKDIGLAGLGAAIAMTVLAIRRSSKARGLT